MSVIAVTGGTGFVGSHLMKLLSERGEAVRCLVRPTSRLDVLDGIRFEPFQGDLRDPGSLVPFLNGCSLLYHVAAEYSLWSLHPEELHHSNVDGTVNILSAALSAGVSRVIYTSTVGCLGIPKDGTPGDENTPVRLEDMIGHYKRSKFLAEKAAFDFVKKGLQLVIVNPSTPVGPGEHKPTPTGKLIVDFLNDKIPAFVNTGLNLIDVRDCAAGHILAAEKGRVGEKYILGSKNLTLAEILGLLARICGRPEPKMRMPYAVAYTAGALSTAWADVVTHRPPGIALESVKMSRKMMFFSPQKAIQELGLPQSPIELALSDAVDWFAHLGYGRRPT